MSRSDEILLGWPLTHSALWSYDYSRRPDTSRELSQEPCLCPISARGVATLTQSVTKSLVATDLVDLGFEAEFRDFTIERAATDLEDLGSLLLVPADGFKDADDVGAFRVGE